MAPGTFEGFYNGGKENGRLPPYLVLYARADPGSYRRNPCNRRRPADPGRYMLICQNIVII